VRGFSDFGFSYVYIIFEDGTISTGPVRARSNISRKSRRACRPASRLNWGRTLAAWVGSSNMRWSIPAAAIAWRRCAAPRIGSCATSCSPCRAWAEVASLGGFVRQYQVNVDPNRLAAYGIPISRVVAAVRGGNNDVGGGWWNSPAANIWCGDAVTRAPKPIWRDLARRLRGGRSRPGARRGHGHAWPDLRRGVADWNGTGDAVSASSSCGREKTPCA